MQQNLHAFLGISDSDSEAAGLNLPAEQLHTGNHYWTGVKTAERLREPGRSDHDILDDILALQQTNEYTRVFEDNRPPGRALGRFEALPPLEYVFDPDKFGKKDPTLTTENYRLSTE